MSNPEPWEVVHCLATNLRHGSPGAAKARKVLRTGRHVPTGLYRGVHRDVWASGEPHGRSYGAPISCNSPSSASYTVSAEIESSDARSLAISTRDGIL